MSLKHYLAVRIGSQFGIQPDFPEKENLEYLIKNGPIHIQIQFTYSHMEDVIAPELPGGYFPTREEFEEFVFRVTTFYDTVGDDWIEWANEKLADRNSSYKAPPPDLSGYVYLAHSKTGHYKIGVSKKPKKRIRAFDTKMPIKVEMIHSFPCDNAYEAEKMLHELFREKHHDGEWFSLTFVDVDSITEIIRFENGTFEVE